MNVSNIHAGKAFESAPPRILFGASEAERLAHYQNQFALLTKHWQEIPWRQWGVGSAKNLGDLLKEIGYGETCLEEVNGQLIRHLEIVIVFVFTKAGQWLVEGPQHMVDGRQRNRRFPYISEKLRIGETPQDTAVRAIREESGGHILIKSDRLLTGEQYDLSEDHPYNTGSTSYPGLHSSKKAYTFALIINPDEYQEEYTEIDVTGSVVVHSWKDQTDHIWLTNTALGEKVKHVLKY